MHTLLYVLGLLLVWSSASGIATAQQAPDMTSGAVSIYQSTEPLDVLKENLHMAITNRGLLVSGALHISEMLNRTAPDLGISTPVYDHAEALEFCSAVLSHRMTQAHPLNLSACPFVIALYTVPENPATVNVVFRKTVLAGDQDGALAATIDNFLHQIVREALELD
jgi:hypothetical protein